MQVQGLLALAGAAVAAVTDWKWRRVPNWLTVSMGVAGLAINVCRGGVAGLLSGLAGATVAFLLFFLPFAMGWMGGGDVKLLIAVGCILGRRGLCWASLYTALAGGLVALLFLFYRQARAGELWQQLSLTGLALVMWLVNGGSRSVGPVSLPATRAALREKLPYAIAIAIGTALAVCRENALL